MALIGLIQLLKQWFSQLHTQVHLFVEYVLAVVRLH